jgi:hypothetical protein
LSVVLAGFCCFLTATNDFSTHPVGEAPLVLVLFAAMAVFYGSEGFCALANLSYLRIGVDSIDYRRGVVHRSWNREHIAGFSIEQRHRRGFVVVHFNGRRPSAVRLPSHFGINARDLNEVLCRWHADATWRNRGTAVAPTHGKPIMSRGKLKHDRT